MRRSFFSYHRTVWPPVWVIVTCVITYSIFEVGMSFVETIGRSANESLQADPELIRIRIGLWCLAACVYAAYRLIRFHPACNQSYTNWLKLSPWTSEKPLPLGPVHPVWQDVVVLGTFGAIAAWRGHLQPWIPAVAFGAVYLVGMTLLLGCTRTSAACVVLGFLWPALTLPGLSPWLFGILIVVTIAVIWWGYQKSLQAFPWDSQILRVPGVARVTGGSQIQLNVPGLSNNPAIRTTSGLGWPYAALSPKVQCFEVSIGDAFVMSLTLGWWCFCASLRFGIPALPEVIFLFAIVAAFIRFAIYTSGLASSFNLRGRIAARQFIVPGFDKVFITPLIAVVFAALGAIAIRFSGSWYPLVQSSVIGLICFALLAGPLTLKSWILTGQHRYRLPARVNLRQDSRLTGFSRPGHS